MINYVKTLRKNLQNLEAAKKTYAVAQSRGTMSLSEFAKHIAAHNSKYGKADILAVTTELVSCMKEQLLDGYRIQLGDLGTFGLNLKSKGVCESVADEETGEKPVFSASDIVGINVTWTKGSDFDSDTLMAGASFQEVDSLAAQAAVLKANATSRATGSTSTSGTSGNPVQE